MIQYDTMQSIFYFLELDTFITDKPYFATSKTKLKSNRSTTDSR